MSLLRKSISFNTLFTLIAALITACAYAMDDTTQHQIIPGVRYAQSPPTAVPAKTLLAKRNKAALEKIDSVGIACHAVVGLRGQTVEKFAANFHKIKASEDPLATARSIIQNSNVQLPYLQLAAKMNDLETFKILNEAGAPCINYGDTTHYPLDVALKEGYLSIVAEILENPAMDRLNFCSETTFKLWKHGPALLLYCTKSYANYTKNNQFHHASQLNNTTLSVAPPHALQSLAQNNLFYAPTYQQFRKDFSPDNPKHSALIDKILHLYNDHPETPPTDAYERAKRCALIPHIYACDTQKIHKHLAKYPINFTQDDEELVWNLTACSGLACEVKNLRPPDLGFLTYALSYRIYTAKNITDLDSIIAVDGNHIACDKPKYIPWIVPETFLAIFPRPSVLDVVARKGDPDFIRWLQKTAGPAIPSEKWLKYLQEPKPQNSKARSFWKKRMFAILDANPDLILDQQTTDYLTANGLIGPDASNYRNESSELLDLLRSCFGLCVPPADTELTRALIEKNK